MKILVSRLAPCSLLLTCLFTFAAGAQEPTSVAETEGEGADSQSGDDLTAPLSAEELEASEKEVVQEQSALEEQGDERKSAQEALSEEALEAEVDEYRGLYLDSFAAQFGYSFAEQTRKDINGGVADINEDNQSGFAVNVGVFLASPQIPELKPYLDFTRRNHPDRNFT